MSEESSNEDQPGAGQRARPPRGEPTRSDLPPNSTLAEGTWGRFTRGTAAARSEAQFSAPLQRESSFDARYEAQELLGRGGMGEVHLCLDRRTERQVAVKRIYASLRDDETRGRFLREARVQARLDHPTVVPVYDLGVDAEGNEYFTMKPAVGLTLSEVIHRLWREEPEFSRRFPLPVRLRIFRQICQGVEYAHARGILHRDLKPSNVIIGELGETYLLDWGISKAAPIGLDSDSHEDGRSGALGTPGYMAPEQLDNADAVDARADVHALGAILFELVTLEPLYAQRSTADVIKATREGSQERRISRRRPDLEVPPALEQLCYQATATDPDERPASVSKLLEPVADFLDGDRDLALRNSLAQSHADAARAALEAMLAQGDPDDRLRAQSLREAGHALALDPHCQDAVEVFTQLLATPPETLPREAAAMVEEYEEAGTREMSRTTASVYLAVLPLILWLILSVEIRNWLAVAAMVVPLAFVTGAVFLQARGDSQAPTQRFAVYGALVLIAATSTLAGPFLIAPGLLAGFVAVATSYVKVAALHPLRWAFTCLIAALAPMALQAAGWLPVEMQFDPGGRVMVLHRISDASPATMYATLLGALVLAVLAPIVSAYRTARLIRELRTRLVVQMWHLRKLTSR